MTPSLRALSRKAPKRTALIEQIRSGIVRGDLPPGTQLPPRAEMVKTLRTCMNTLQSALKILEDDGFIRSKPNEGTFVSDKPPHLSRYGIVLSPDPTGLRAPFDAALLRELGSIEKERDCRFASYHNITAHSDTVEYQELLWDIRAHRVAGLLFRDDFSETDLSDTPFCTAPGIPRVILCADPRDPSGHAGMAAICTDDHAFSDRALDHLRERGRCRLALLTGTELAPNDITDFTAQALRRGMAVKPHWILSPSVSQARRVTELLMSLPPSERPDALILTYETFIDPVCAGILASGVRAGQELDVVANSNMPCHGATLVPVRRLGADMRQRLRVALDLLDRQQRGEPMAPLVLLPPVFEEESSMPPASVRVTP